MRRALIVLTCLSVVAASCGGDDGDSTDSTGAESTTSVVATEPPATEPPATEPPAATDPPAAAAAAIVPEVVCRVRDGDVVFAYTNESATPVVLESASSTVENSPKRDAEFITVVFAPGRVSPAFWASPRSDRRNAPRPAWTVVGPDGVSRTAAADADTPRCTNDLLEPTTGDDRNPELVASDLADSVDGDSVDVTFSVTGVPGTSVCPAGLDAGPVSFTWDDGSTDTELTRTATFGVFTTVDGLDAAATAAHITVLDICGYEGTTQSIWPGRAFENLYAGASVCAVRQDDGGVVVATEDQCPRVAPTGGSRNRPN
jgi:hypothetical protein